MKAVVAYRDADDTPEALELGAMLRRTTGCDLVVVAVLPPTSADTMEERGPDRDYRTWLDQVAAEAEGAARSALDAEGAIEFVRVAAASVAAGLIEAVAKVDADVLVLGSAREAVEGSWLAGSVATKLLHSSKVPIMLAPQGYVGDAGAKFESITCAYAGTEHSTHALEASCELAKRFDARLWIGTFAPISDTMYPPPVGFDAEDMVTTQWAEQAHALQAEALAYCAAHEITDVRSFIAQGDGWDGALNSVEWDEHDLLVMGSSRLGPIARVFLGSTATKIMRYTPVPILVVPTGTYTWSE